MFYSKFNSKHFKATLISVKKAKKLNFGLKKTYLGNVLIAFKKTNVI